MSESIKGREFLTYKLLVREDFHDALKSSINAKIGENVTIIERNAEFPEWVLCLYCGTKVWVHESFIRIDGEQGYFLKDYDSTELSLMKGDEVIVLDSRGGWLYVMTTDGKKGWIPARNFYLKGPYLEEYEEKVNNGWVSHIEINVSNLQNSITFWAFLLKKLGYEEYQIWESGRSWRKDRFYFVIVQTESKHLSATYNRKNIGINHIAFYCNSIRLVDNIRNEMIEKGYSILYDSKYPHAGSENEYSLFVEDPDRIKVEIVVPIS